MKQVAASALVALVANVCAGRPAAASDWGSSVELGASRTLSGDEIFKGTWDLGLAGYRRWRSRYYPGAFLEYRSAVNADPATTFWYADVGLRFLSVFGRVCVRLDIGWALRHIALDQEDVSSTVGGPLFGLGTGAVILRTRRGSLDLLAVSHVTRASTDDLWIASIGFALSWHYYTS